MNIQARAKLLASATIGVLVLFSQVANAFQYPIRSFAQNTDDWHPACVDPNKGILHEDCNVSVESNGVLQVNLAGFPYNMSSVNWSPDNLNLIPRGNGEIIAIDTTHNNRNTLEYWMVGFEKLLEADGYNVTDFTTTYDSMSEQQYRDALARIKVLVIVNAREDIESNEASVLEEWVREDGGRIWYVNDHGFAQHTTSLSDSFGLIWGEDDLTTVNYTVEDMEGYGNPASINGLPLRNIGYFGGSRFAKANAQNVTYGRAIKHIDGQNYIGMELEMNSGSGCGRVYASAEAMMMTAGNTTAFISWWIFTWSPIHFYTGFSYIGENAVDGDWEHAGDSPFTNSNANFVRGTIDWLVQDC